MNVLEVHMNKKFREAFGSNSILEFAPVPVDLIKEILDIDIVGNALVMNASNVTSENLQAIAGSDQSSEYREYFLNKRHIQDYYDFGGSDFLSAFIAQRALG